MISIILFFRTKICWQIKVTSQFTFSAILDTVFMRCDHVVEEDVSFLESLVTKVAGESPILPPVRPPEVLQAGHLLSDVTQLAKNIRDTVFAHH